MPFRLILPLEQMSQENRHPAFKFTLLTLAHVLDLLRNVLQVEKIKLTGTNQPSLFIGPGHHIRLIPRTHVDLLQQESGFENTMASSIT